MTSDEQMTSRVGGRRGEGTCPESCVPPSPRRQRLKAKEGRGVQARRKLHSVYLELGERRYELGDAKELESSRRSSTVSGRASSSPTPTDSATGAAYHPPLTRPVPSHPGCPSLIDRYNRTNPIT